MGARRGADVPSLVFSAAGIFSALALPFVRFRPNRIADGAMVFLAGSLPAAATALALLWAGSRGRRPPEPERSQPRLGGSPCLTARACRGAHRCRRPCRPAFRRQRHGARVPCRGILGDHARKLRRLHLGLPHARPASPSPAAAPLPGDPGSPGGAAVDGIPGPRLGHARVRRAEERLFRGNRHPRRPDGRRRSHRHRLRDPRRHAGRCGPPWCAAWPFSS